MKNLKVGAKILTGFGFAIAMVLVLGVVALITSMSSSERIAQLKMYSELQVEINKVMDRMNDARSNADDAFTHLNDMQSYQSAYSNIDLALSHLGAVENLSSALGGYKSEQNEQMKAHINESKGYVQTVEANDHLMIDAIAQMDSAAVEIHEKVLDVQQRAIDVLGERIESDSALASEYLNQNVVSIQELVESIAVLRVNSAAYVAGLETGGEQELIASLEQITEQTASVRAMLVTQEAKDQLDVLSDALLTYREALNTLTEVMRDSEQKVSSARQSVDAILDVIRLGIDDVANDMHIRMDGVVKSTNTNLIVVLSVSLAVIAVSIITAIALGRIITRPIKQMQSVLLQVTNSGDLHFSQATRDAIKHEALAKDELGQCNSAFAQFVERICYIGDLLEQVASGDLTKTATLLSKEDTLGVAINSMVDHLNDMFAEIQLVSNQLAVSSSEVATGAQSLAQGATEQASTVQQISSSISMMSEQADQGAKTAYAAARESMDIRDIALKGNEKMREMIEAVDEINKASNAIEQVIKTIEEIAFQTNLLALNASVEAAHAGKQGMGFAIVANEVKTLATRSAAATKETSELINANIEKARLGMSICHETAKSLESIMEGIRHTAQTMEDIAQQSEGSKNATSQVSTAMEQVAIVVQQNSATSQESAAASQEMNSQAQTLRSLLGQFRLRKSERREAIAAESQTYGASQERNSIESIMRY